MKFFQWCREVKHSSLSHRVQLTKGQLTQYVDSVKPHLHHFQQNCNIVTASSHIYMLLHITLNIITFLVERRPKDSTYQGFFLSFFLGFFMTQHWAGRSTLMSIPPSCRRRRQRVWGRLVTHTHKHAARLFAATVSYSYSRMTRFLSAASSTVDSRRLASRASVRDKAHRCRTTEVKM